MTKLHRTVGWARVVEPASELVHIAKRFKDDYGDPLLFPVCVSLPGTVPDYASLRRFSETRTLVTCVSCLGSRLLRFVGEIFDGREDGVEEVFDGRE